MNPNWSLSKKKTKIKKKQTNPKKKLFFWVNLNSLSCCSTVHFPLHLTTNLSTRMSFLQFTFRPTLIPAYAQAEFISRFAQLVLDYETLIEPAPPSPPADSLPPPSSFVPVAGDGAEGEAGPEQAKKRGPKRKMSADSLTPKTLEQMTAQELRVRLGALMGIPADSPQFRNHSKFPNKAALIAEIRRLEAEPAPAPVPVPVPAPAPVPVPVAEAEVPVVETGSVAPSETSSAKQRKNGWADLTPEQKADRLARAAATRQARRATKMASASSDGESA